MVANGFDLTPYRRPGTADAVARRVFYDEIAGQGEAVGLQLQSEGAGFDDLPAFVGEMIGRDTLCRQGEVHLEVAAGRHKLLGMNGKNETEGDKQGG